MIFPSVISMRLRTAWRKQRKSSIWEIMQANVYLTILIEEIGKPVVYIVRGAPIINDATYDDAVVAGIDQVATILPSGTDAPGTILRTCSVEFMEMYQSAECIISKGQGNYEALSGENRPIFFLLKTKCPVIAADSGVREGSIILKCGETFHEDS